jgi:hypothetical protein
MARRYENVVAALERSTPVYIVSELEKKVCCDHIIPFYLPHASH